MKNPVSKRSLLQIAFVLILALALGTAALLTLRTLRMTLPEALEYRPAEGSASITSAEIAAAQDALGDQLLVSAQNCTVASARTASGRSSSSSIDLVQTDSTYSQIHPLFLRKGAFFLPRNASADQRVCVISTGLSTELFFSLDALGQQVLLNGEAYTVIGVYQANDGLLDRISADGREKVLLPYATAQDAQGKLDVIYVQGHPKDAATGKASPASDPRVTSTLRNALDAALGRKLDSYTCTDYFQIQRLLAQGERFFWFGMGLVAFCYIAQLLVRAVTNAWTWLQRTRHSTAPVRFGPLAGRMALPLVCVTAMVALYFLCRFQLYWPPEYVPAGKQLLDLPFYWDLILRSFQQFNSSAHSSYDCLRFYGSWLATGLGVASLLTWWRALATAWNIIKEKLAV